MSDLERVTQELTRLTERLRAVNDRKGSEAIAVRHYRGKITAPRSPIARLRRNRRIS